MRLTRLWAALPLACLVACGSTVPNAASRPVAPGAGGLVGPDAGPVGAATSANTVAGQGPAPGVASSVTGTVGGPAITGTASQPGATGAPTTGAARPSAVGVTDTTLTLGFSDDTNAAAANTAIGGNSSTFNGDQTGYIKAFVDDVNRAGGIAGRRVVAVRYVYDDTSAQPFDQQDAAACASWTQDHHVFAVLHANHSDALRDCLAKHGTPGIATSETDAGSATFNRYPLFVEATSVNLDRQAQVMADGLHQQGFYAGAVKPKIGLFRINSTDMAHAAGVLRQSLRPYGLGIDKEFVLDYPQSTASYSEAISATQSAALQFAAAGITHVLFLTFNQAPSAFFMLAAENQHYRPRYGLTSQQGPQALHDTGVPDAQFEGARFVGWEPDLDVPTGRTPPPTAQRRRCQKVLAEAGVAASGGNAMLTAMGYCDALWFLRSVLGTAKVPLSTSSFTAGLARVGTSYVPADTFATDFRGRRDGVAQWREGAWSDAAACFVYTGGVHSF